MESKLLRKADIIVIVIAAVAAGIFMLYRYFDNSAALTAQIIVDGEVVETLDLSEVTNRVEFVPDTSPKVVIAAENGEIWFEDAECPDKICVAAGKLSGKGDTAVCLPAKTIVTISGSAVDAVTY